MNHLEPNKSDLFRQEAIAARRDKFAGDIVLSYPFPVWILTGFVAVSMVGILMFVFLGSYTRRVTVSGQLIPVTDIVRVYAPQPGIVLEKHVVEGQSVTAGQVLYTLTSDRRSGAIGNTQETISRLLERRHFSFDEELRNTQAMQRAERNALLRKTNSISQQLATMKEQLAVQKARLDITGDAVSRYARLYQRRLISKDQLQQRESEKLEQQLKIHSLDRERGMLQQELMATKEELLSLPLKQQNHIAQIERAIGTIDQELTESEAKRTLVVLAPRAGIVSAMVMEAGQLTDGTRPLLTLVPQGAMLQANLFAPGRAIGFMKPGDAVLLRYQAFPYQKFGQYRGRLLSISRSAMTANELAIIGGNVPSIDPGQGSELYYRIVVALESQKVMAYGQAQALQSGLVVEADILQDSRKIVEWILEPIYGLRGKLAA